jgi:hypothetical protein
MDGRERRQRRGARGEREREMHVAFFRCLFSCNHPSLSPPRPFPRRPGRTHAHTHHPGGPCRRGPLPPPPTLPTGRCGRRAARTAGRGGTAATSSSGWRGGRRRLARFLPGHAPGLHCRSQGHPRRRRRRQQGRGRPGWRDRRAAPGAATRLSRRGRARAPRRRWRGRQPRRQCLARAAASAATAPRRGRQERQDATVRRQGGRRPAARGRPLQGGVHRGRRAAALPIELVLQRPPGPPREYALHEREVGAELSQRRVEEGGISRRPPVIGQAGRVRARV